MDGIDDMLWNGKEEDSNVRCVCKEDEGNDCEDGDSNSKWKRQMESDFFFVYYTYEINGKTLFQADTLLLGIVPWWMFYVGGRPAISLLPFG
jgi:hypothetical protein